MIFFPRVRSKLKNFWKRISESSPFLWKMSVNEVPGGDQFKRAHDDDDDDDDDADNAEGHKKLRTNDIVPFLRNYPRRKKFAILLGYNGSKYKGMQLNKDIETIELHLLKALLQAGVIRENEFNEVHLTKFQRAARTDKGVSAVHQVVSIVMSEKFTCEEINSYLPADIRVFSIKRATKNFNSKGNCNARTYSYLLPTQVLSQEPMNNFLETDYRISPDSIKEVNEILSLYHGTHSFHNFTHKRLFGDPSCKRYIMSFTCGEPFVRGKEFVLLTVKGQSFMLHQIRKMVGTLIAIMRGLSTPDIIKTAFLGENLRIPIAPAEGLFLEKPHFDNYDKRYGLDGFHECLTWVDVKDEVMKFREENIISQIIENELKNQVMAEWIENYLCPIERSVDVDARSHNANEEAEPEEKTVLTL